MSRISRTASVEMVLAVPTRMLTTSGQVVKYGAIFNMCYGTYVSLLLLARISSHNHDRS